MYVCSVFTTHSFPFVYILGFLLTGWVGITRKKLVEVAYKLFPDLITNNHLISNFLLRDISIVKKKCVLIQIYKNNNNRRKLENLVCQYSEF